MDTAQFLSVTGRRPLLGALALGLLAALAGCDTTEEFVSSSPPPACSAGPPVYTVQACQIAAKWEPNVLFLPDPSRDGARNPGIAGRVYLFGVEAGTPLVGNGCLAVDLYDDTQPGGPVLVERWNIDSDTLRRLLTRDFLGWGY